MPEYLAPGVYVEERSFRSKSIEGVSTTTTAFVGPTRYGPLYDDPDVITSITEFEATYGDGMPLEHGGTEFDNYMWHAARAFFSEGGKRLYVKRIYRSADTDDPDVDQGGRASGGIGTGAGSPLDYPIDIQARHPGAYGNFQVKFTLNLGLNVLASQGGNPRLRGVSDYDLVVLRQAAQPTRFKAARLVLDEVTGERVWRFEPAEPGSPPNEHTLAELNPATDSVHVVTVSVSVAENQPGALPVVWPELPLDAQHKTGGAPDSIHAVFDRDRPAAQRTPIVVDLGNNDTGLEVLQALFAAGGMGTESPPVPLLETALLNEESSEESRTISVALVGGSDGDRPEPANFEGKVRPDDTKTGLVAVEDLEDVSIVAAPGSTFGYNNGWADNGQAIVNNLIAHSQRMKYRIAVIDAGNDMTVAQVREMRAQFDSSHAALYYPWVEILDPITGEPNHMPPSGFVAGIYARNDIERAVYKAPANEVVNLSIGFERPLNKAQQEVLNPEGINAFRFFEGRGNRLWGARTMSSDQEWKYVNLRRYFAFVERSIDRGTQWAVFEPNGEALWANVRRTIDDFLLDQWQNGALLGEKPEKAYFVRCDRSTMTQNDLDNGRLVCLIGLAPLRPAEFVIFRIGQWTADAKK
jgi:phage tail sheath protein FI